MTAFARAADQVMQQLQQLATISQHSEYLDRRYLSDEHFAANALVAHWMSQSAMQHHTDAAGNLWGRLSSGTPDAPRFIMGSHLDTVPNGGKYDGMLGVVAAVMLAKLLDEYAVQLPFHLDIVGFGDEEGTRFGSTLLGSRALTGSWPASWRNLTDADHISLPQAMQNVGLRFDDVRNAALTDTDILGFLELHIEQGPVLEDENLPIGIVNAIAGARRFEFRVTGMAGHAGTVPMRLRKDALTASAKMIVAIEQLAIEHDIVATVGQIKNQPNGVNVISGETLFSLDIRSGDDMHRDKVVELIINAATTIASQHSVKLLWRQTHEAAAVSCDASLQSLLHRAIDNAGYSPLYLPSGAGHDAMAMAQICPVAMLFTRCDKGISHHPDENICVDDVEVTLQVLFETLILLSKQHTVNQNAAS